MHLAFNIKFSELYNSEPLIGLRKLDFAFKKFVLRHPDFNGKELVEFLEKYKNNPQLPDTLNSSDVIINLSPLLEEFISELFCIIPKVQDLQLKEQNFSILYQCRRQFVQRYAIQQYPQNSLSQYNFLTVKSELLKFLSTPRYSTPPSETNKVTAQIRNDSDMAIDNYQFATNTIQWFKQPEKYAQEIKVAAIYAAFKVYFPLEYPSRSPIEKALFHLPQRINPDPDNYISSFKIVEYSKQVREGFDYYAPELNSINASTHANYCIYCHKQNKDSCSKGLGIKQHEILKQVQDNKILNRGDDQYKQNINEQQIKQGCPLKQKISEMNYVKAQGLNIAALAIIMINNPLVAATGHRICNDCMHACIFQKQDPVDVPVTESEIFRTVLALPYGLEIYLLLTRWNPLNIRRPLPSTNTGYNIFVTGLGPAGFSISYYMLRAGHNVVAVDGLKVSPLPFNIYEPIKNWSDYSSKLSEKTPQGFGGVCEYGITSRWDKNNLTILRLILERWHNFKLYGSVRLGSNITSAQVFELGFDHIALCVGAGTPKLPNIENKQNVLTKGAKMATDFLMTLQSGGGFLKTTNTNLVLRLPCVIIGGGLTAIDAATEILYYYPLQVENFYQKYQQVRSTLPPTLFTAEEQEVINEFIKHANLLRDKNSVTVQKILKDLGGVNIIYHRDLRNSPAYQINADEITRALANGINIIDNSTTQDIEVNSYGSVNEVKIYNNQTQEVKNILARTILYATGMEKSNVQQYQTNIDRYFKRFSYYGDCTTEYRGSVVKAIASSKNNYQKVTNSLKNTPPLFKDTYESLTNQLDNLLQSTVKEVKQLSDKLLELVVHAPLAAANWQPGQIFRLQNQDGKTQDTTEPIPLSVASIDQNLGLLYFVIKLVGKSTSLCRNLLPGDKIMLMGPVGMPIKLPFAIQKTTNDVFKDNTQYELLLIGCDTANSTLISLAQQLKKHLGNRVKITYIALYSTQQDVFYQEKITAIADRVFWCCPQNSLTKLRDKDVIIEGDFFNALDLMKQQNYIEPSYVICAVQNELLSQISRNKGKYFLSETPIICYVNSLMWCMMQGVCGQCIQTFKGDESMKSSFFACACQYQEISMLDETNTTNRLKQNNLFEKLNNYL